MDYRELGLKVGLEIHQRLKSHKLFCRCPSHLREDDPHIWVKRRLGVSYSELGAIDPAARFEAVRAREFFYGAYIDTTCEVEIDEAPPIPLNKEALEIALQIAEMFNMEVVDEVHVMRKIVVDGSNTTGFQRTALVALGGDFSTIPTKWGDVRIATLCLEEESAYIVESKPSYAKYRLDRLGIPLVEIATYPDIWHPEQAKEAALKIGRMLRATDRVLRGIGTIRQDINVSIERGARQEIKGVQELDLIPKIIEREVMRQLNLLEIMEEMRSRGLAEDNFKKEFRDLTSVLRESKSKLVKSAISSGKLALGVRLPGMKGLLGRELQPKRRFGTELSDYAKVFGGVKGILHGDELPGYGISEDEVRNIADELGCESDDSFVIVLADRDSGELALGAVVDRVRQALRGVPNETRRALPDGNTSFLRPMPGSARMYPETDILPVVTSPYLEVVRKIRVRTPESIVKDLVESYGLTEELAWDLLDSDRETIFVRAYTENPDLPARFFATVLTGMMRSIRREGYDVSKVGDSHLLEIARLLASGKLAKEAVEEVIKGISSGKYSTVYQYLEEARISDEKLERIVDEAIKRLSHKVKERGEKAFGPVMGEVMKVVRGKVDGAKVSELVRKKIREFLEEVGK